MDSFFIKIDDTLLETFEPHLKTKLELKIKEMISFSQKELGAAYPNISDIDTYIRMCPYCNKFYTVQTGGVGLRYCMHCGETTPFEKIKYSMRKVNVLYNISISTSVNSGVERIEYTDNVISREETNSRFLLEQCIVVLATGIEIFFREIFAIAMDLKFVKSDLSLFSKFYAGTKNDFIIIGNGKKEFKRNLNIDLDLLLGKEILKELNVLMLKRNVIVHNNGMADTIFIKQSNIKCELGKQIPISKEEIKHYLSTVQELIRQTEREFDKSILPELLKKASFHINNFK